MASSSLVAQYQKLLAKLTRAQQQSLQGIKGVGNLSLPQLMALEQQASASDKTAGATLGKDAAAPMATNDAATKALMADLLGQGADTGAVSKVASQSKGDVGASANALNAYSDALSSRLAAQNAGDTNYSNALTAGAQTDVNNKIALDRYNAQQQFADASAGGGGGGGGRGGGGRRGYGGGGSSNGLTEAQMNSLAQKLVGLKGSSGRLDQKTLDALASGNKINMDNPLNAEVVNEVEKRALSGYGPETTAAAMQQYLQSLNPNDSAPVINPQQHFDQLGNPTGTAQTKYARDVTALDNFIQAIGRREGGVGNPQTKQDAQDNYLNDFGFNFARLAGQDPGEHPPTIEEGSPYGAWNPTSLQGQDAVVQGMDAPALMDFANRHPLFDSLDSTVFSRMDPAAALDFANRHPAMAMKIPALKLMAAKAQQMQQQNFLHSRNPLNIVGAIQRAQQNQQILKLQAAQQLALHPTPSVAPPMAGQPGVAAAGGVDNGMFAAALMRAAAQNPSFHPGQSYVNPNPNPQGGFGGGSFRKR